MKNHTPVSLLRVVRHSNLTFDLVTFLAYASFNILVPITKLRKTKIFKGTSNFSLCSVLGHYYYGGCGAVVNETVVTSEMGSYIGVSINSCLY